jgi:hypothetical protein
MTDERHTALVLSAGRALHQLQRSEPVRWESVALAHTLPALLDAHSTPEAFLAWAQGHPSWSLSLAECLSQVCAKPREMAVFLLRTIAEELIDEGGVCLS